MQIKKRSILESITNVIVGFGIAYLSQRLIFPLFDIYISRVENLWIILWFTFISMGRSYILRRIFNRKDDSKKSIKKPITKPIKRNSDSYYAKMCNKKCRYHKKPLIHCRILCKKHIYQDEGYCSLYKKKGIAL